jgi:hypothetical protein
MKYVVYEARVIMYDNVDCDIQRDLQKTVLEASTIVVGKWMVLITILSSILMITGTLLPLCTVVVVA